MNTYYSGLKREQQLYRYLLGNGATRQEAQAPFIKQAIIKSFSPLIANIAVMGLVALPGTMIGQILGGSSPNVAIKISDDDYGYYLHGFHAVTDDYYFTGFPKII